VNSLANQIFRKYTISDRYLEEGQALILSPRLLDAFLDYLEEELVFEVGKETGSLAPRDQLLMRGKPSEYDTCIWFLTEILDECYDWFDCEIHSEENHDLIFLRHLYNEKWSAFLAGYLESMFHVLLELDVDIEYTSQSLNFSLDK
jgi:hypothetical protein